MLPLLKTVKWESVVRSKAARFAKQPLSKTVLTTQVARSNETLGASCVLRLGLKTQKFIKIAISIWDPLPEKIVL